MYVPCGSKDAAERLVQSLLMARQIACGNIISSQSLYFWNEKLNSEEEYIAILKTSYDHKQILFDQIQELHDYDLPCILAVEAETTEAYAKWVLEQIEK